MVIGSQGVSLWELGHSESLCDIALVAHFAVNKKLSVSEPVVLYAFISI